MREEKQREYSKDESIFRERRAERDYYSKEENRLAEENKNIISYDEDWKNVSSVEYPQFSDYNYEEEQAEEEAKQKPKKKNRDSPRQLLITFQLIACILVILAAVLIKSIGGNLYSAVRDWYYTNLNNTAIFYSALPDFDMQNLLGLASRDEA